MLLLTGLAVAARPEAVGFVDSERGRVRCHWADARDAERCAEVAAWAEEAWDAQVDGIGFPAPRPDGEEGGSAALDVYLTREAGGAGVAWVDCDGGDPDCVDDDPADGRAASPSHVVIDPRTDDADFRAYVHHEFAHTLQYATDFAEPFLALWEGTAVAAERWTDPAWTTSADDLADYQASPWLSAVLQDGWDLWDLERIESWYEYGAVAWIWFLDAEHGDGAGSVGPRLWAATAQEGRGAEPDVLDAWATVAGAWEPSMLAFAAERARMGTEAGPAWAAFAGEAAYAWREGLVPADGARLTPTAPPYPLGTAYWDLEGLEAGARLAVAVDGDPGVRWGIVVVDGGETVTEGVSAGHVASGDPLTVGIVNLGPEGMDADDPLAPAAFTVTFTRVPDPAGVTPEGCGCATGGSGAPLTGILLAFALARRRVPVGAGAVDGPARATSTRSGPPHHPEPPVALGP